MCAGGSKGVPEKTVSEGLLVSCEDVLSSHAAFITHGGFTGVPPRANNLT